MSLLPGTHKAKSDFLVGSPSNLPVSIAVIEIQAGEAVKYRQRISHMDISVRQDRTQLAAGTNPDQQLFETSADRGVPPNLIIMSRKSNADERSYHQRPLDRIVAEVQMHILKCRMEKAVIERTVGTQAQGALRMIPLGRYIRHVKVERQVFRKAIF